MSAAALIRDQLPADEHDSAWTALFESSVGFEPGRLGLESGARERLEKLVEAIVEQDHRPGYRGRKFRLEITTSYHPTRQVGSLPAAEVARVRASNTLVALEILLEGAKGRVHWGLIESMRSRIALNPAPEHHGLELADRVVVRVSYKLDCCSGRLPAPRPPWSPARG
jgi:hypothetical protein